MAIEYDNKEGKIVRISAEGTCKVLIVQISYSASYFLSLLFLIAKNKKFKTKNKTHGRTFKPANLPSLI